jgi:5-oxoprolinase (ATP-hydrolysing)
MACNSKFRFSIDRGGTFTDIHAQTPQGGHRVLKLLSEDPDNYPDAPREGIRRILEEVRMLHGGGGHADAGGIGVGVEQHYRSWADCRSLARGCLATNR